MKSVNDLFSYFDEIVDSGSDDDLFASSYLKDFINLAILELEQGNELSAALFTKVAGDVKAAKAELSPQDQLIVNQFWQGLQPHFT